MKNLSSRFRVLRALRETRASRTLVALDLSTENQTVLIKIFRRRQVQFNRAETDRMLSLFRGINHPHLVPITNSGLTKDGDIYVVREFLPLLVSSRELLLEEVKCLISTMSFLYSHGYVHGAIKPSNVFRTISAFRLSDPQICMPRAIAQSAQEIKFT